jgi:hypothetical protein
MGWRKASAKGEKIAFFDVTDDESPQRSLRNAAENAPNKKRHRVSGAFLLGFGEPSE